MVRRSANCAPLPATSPSNWSETPFIFDAAPIPSENSEPMPGSFSAIWRFCAIMSATSLFTKLATTLANSGLSVSRSSPRSWVACIEKILANRSEIGSRSTTVSSA